MEVTTLLVLKFRKNLLSLRWRAGRLCFLVLMALPTLCLAAAPVEWVHMFSTNGSTFSNFRGSGELCRTSKSKYLAKLHSIEGIEFEAQIDIAAEGKVHAFVRPLLGDGTGLVLDGIGRTNIYDGRTSSYEVFTFDKRSGAYFAMLFRSSSPKALTSVPGCKSK